MQAALLRIVVAFLATLFANVAARANPALLFEPASGKVLYSEDVDDLWHPASLTKIMTAYVVFDAIKEGKLHLDDKIPCSLVATLQPPSKAGIRIGETLTVEKALQAVIIKSANDVTVMLAEAVAGNEQNFVARMNETARRLGMTKTNYVNTNGLPDPAQITSARDIARLARAVVADFPQYNSYWALPDMRLGKRRLGNHNALLKTFPGADGLKTGFTCDSGYNVVASATRDGRRLMAVVLGESSGDERAVRSATLLEYGFQSFAWKDMFNMASLDNLPTDAAAKSSITTVRETVAAWGCHPGRRAVATHKRGKNKLAGVKKRSGKKKDGSVEAQAATKSPDPAPAAQSVAQPKAASATEATQ